LANWFLFHVLELPPDSLTSNISPSKMQQLVVADNFEPACRVVNLYRLFHKAIMMLNPQASLSIEHFLYPTERQKEWKEIMNLIYTFFYFRESSRETL